MYNVTCDACEATLKEDFFECHCELKTLGQRTSATPDMKHLCSNCYWDIFGEKKEE